MATGRTRVSGPARSARPGATRGRSDGTGAQPRAKGVGGPLVSDARGARSAPARPAAERRPAPAAAPKRPAPAAAPKRPAPAAAPKRAAPAAAAPARTGPVAAERPVGQRPPVLPVAPGTPGAPALPAVPVGGEPVGPITEWSAVQVVAGMMDLADQAAGVQYRMGLGFRELARPARYRDELGFASFDALLQAYDLKSRQTAYKLILMVSSFSFAEVKAFGGSEKIFHATRLAKIEDPNGDVRRILAPRARVLGLEVAALSSHALRDAVKALGVRPKLARGPAGIAVTPANDTGELVDPRATHKAADRLRRALAIASILARVRVHHEDGEACVMVHLGAEATVLLSQLLRLGVAHAPQPAPD